MVESQNSWYIPKLELYDRIIKIANTCLVYFRPVSFDFGHHVDGGYALITGGAGGIGKTCAHHFAQRGINLFLIDYNAKLLEQTGKELSGKYPTIDVKLKAMDLTQLTDNEVFDQFKASIADVKIGILFNNAGIAEYKLLDFTANTHKDITTWVFTWTKAEISPFYSRTAFCWAN